jgi:D-3-phosphoglycerate dehydrogenase
MKILITDHAFPNHDQEDAIFKAAGIPYEMAQCKTEAEVVKIAGDADALVVQFAPIKADVIAALKKCKVIVRYGIGVDNVDLKAAAAKNIPVCNVPDYCIDEVADHAMALALALARQLPQTDAAVRAGTWKIMPPRPFPAFRDTIFATVGFGRIARAVLERAKVFGFQLAAYDPFVDASVFAGLGVKKLEREELFAKAGILSLHLPFSAETKHFVGKASLAAMNPNAIVVNTARGGLIDTVALAEALTAKTIAGAGIDVFETEPLEADHPLRQASNAILTSHTAWYSGGSIPILQRKVAEEAVRALKGEALKNVVNGVKP